MEAEIQPILQSEVELESRENKMSGVIGVTGGKRSLLSFVHEVEQPIENLD